MDIPQLKTFVTVAREGSITRASELLHLSQPAVSAHVKALEDAFGLALFERTPRGMVLTADGERLLAKAERTLSVHRELVDEAARMKGRVAGKLRLGAGGSSSHEGIGRLVGVLSERHPDVEVALRHGTSREILAGLRSGALDAGFYNEPGEPEADLATIDVSRFTIHVAASPGLVTTPLDWDALAELPWIYPTSSACCGRAAEDLFREHRIQPKRIISVDREDATRSLVAGGVGIGLLHEDTAKEAEARGDVVLLAPSKSTVRVLFAHLKSRADEPLIAAAASVMRVPHAASATRARPR